MTKILWLKNVFAKIAIFSIKMSESKIYLRLTKATNTSMQISRNTGTTKKASRKMVYDNVFFKLFVKKAIFYSKSWQLPKQIVSQTSVHWYQCISL